LARQCFFITGTDTEVGKTWITAGLLEACNRQGVDAVAMKPVAAGALRTSHGLRNEDALILQRAAGRHLAYELINPFVFEPAIAPHLAAHAQGDVLSSANILDKYQEFEAQVRAIGLVEGAGGWQVPLNMQETWVDFVQAAELPVILVVGLRLGCINHALLTVESIRRTRIPLVAWVANHLQPQMPYWQQNLHFLKQKIKSPLLGVVPYLAEFDVAELAQHLDLSTLMQTYVI
jgi:dethiobiotin synthetase